MEDNVAFYNRTGNPSPSVVIGLFLGGAEMRLKQVWEVLSDPSFATQILELVVLIWKQFRAAVVVPLLNIAVFFCLMMTLMILVEKIYVGMVSLTVKVFGLKPEKRYRWEPIKEDAEMGSLTYPMVLVQIPMYNEKEVYKHSIGAACGLEWPPDRLIIQVLDDSTNPVVKDLVVSECQRWKSKGVNIKYEVRDNRNGYKAGALKEGLKHDYAQYCDYVAIFDADFRPESDFLTRLVPFLAHNSEIALVQARWKFVNADECLLTRMQEMSLDYHFKVEQEAGSSVFSFFGFNGTAGVWRLAAINEAGGWKDRTTVEDMDLAVRASLRGWKFLYVGNLKVKSELPSTLKAFRNQQRRWSCGPANLFKKVAMDIIRSKNISIAKKFHLVYDFFFVGKIVAHTVTFMFYCVVIPLSAVIPEVVIPKWGVVYVPTVITLCKSVGTPSSIHLVVFWILFENVLSLHRIKAAITGLLGTERVNEWIVTEKLGDAHKTKPIAEEIKIAEKLMDAHQGTLLCTDRTKKPKTDIWNRIYLSELCVGVFLLFCGYCDIEYAKKGYYLYLFPQGIAFLVAGFGWLGTHVPAS